MNENLNLVEILKDCPKGTKLYSTVFGDVEFHKIDLASDSTLKIYVKIWAGVIVRFHHSGKMELSCRGECTLFPSKDQRDWSKFKPTEAYITLDEPQEQPKQEQPTPKQEIDWEQRRYEIAKERLPIIYWHGMEAQKHGQSVKRKDTAYYAVIFADTLIKELKEKSE